MHALADPALPTPDNVAVAGVAALANQRQGDNAIHCGGIAQVRSLVTAGNQGRKGFYEPDQYFQNLSCDFRNYPWPLGIMANE